MGTPVELEITNVAHGGVFVARHEGRVIFVSDTLPGERVMARISDASQKSFWRADTVEVLQASAHRQHHIWSASSIDRDPSERAGGAEFGHIHLAAQRELKKFVIEDSLQRMAKLERSVEVAAMPGDDASAGTGWRTRVRLHVDSSGQVGPYAARSHRVIPVQDLPLATAAIADMAPLERRLSDVDFVDLVDPSNAQPRQMVGRVEGGEEITLATAEPITEKVGERFFTLDAGGFWQVHRHAAVTLTSAVQNAIDDQLFDPRAANLDLYGGVGLLAAAVGDRFGGATRITSIESDERATEYASENLVDWVGARAQTARVDRYLEQVLREASASERSRFESATVVLDPPRSGAGKVVVHALTKLQPAQIVYVACDPVALARDVSLLREGGYELTGLNAFDLFPNTHHVEAVASFVRN